MPDNQIINNLTETNENILPNETLDLSNKRSFGELNDYEKALIVKRSNEVGIHETAKEFHIKWQLVVTVRNQTGAGKLSTLNKKTKSSNNSADKNLLRENARLKKEIATLSWQIDRLRIAIKDLVN